MPGFCALGELAGLSETRLGCEDKFRTLEFDAQ